MGWGKFMDTQHTKSLGMRQMHYLHMCVCVCVPVICMSNCCGVINGHRYTANRQLLEGHVWSTHTCCLCPRNRD